MMKVRRCCCDTRLVGARNTEPEVAANEKVSSKMRTFRQIIDELLANRHKALVFSQFVDYLKIVRAFVEEKQIRYQYLDGSTPVKEREKRVNAFQAGDGDLFLISLRAGG